MAVVSGNGQGFPQLDCYPQHMVCKNNDIAHIVFYKGGDTISGPLIELTRGGAQNVEKTICANFAEIMTL